MKVNFNDEEAIITYDGLNDLEIANEFANLTFIYGGRIALTSEQMKVYQKAIRNLIEEREKILNEQAEVSISVSAHNRILELEKENKRLKKYEKYYEEQNEVNKKFIAKDKIREKIEKLKYGENCTYCNNCCNKYLTCITLKKLLEEE